MFFVRHIPSHSPMRKNTRSKSKGHLLSPLEKGKGAGAPLLPPLVHHQAFVIVTMLNNMVDKYKECAQQNIVQYCFDQYCYKSFVFRSRVYISKPITQGPDTRCKFSCNLQCNSTFGRCKIGKYMFPSQFANIFFIDETFVTNLYPLRVELRCKLQEKLHRVTGPSLT